MHEALQFLPVQSIPSISVAVAVMTGDKKREGAIRFRVKSEELGSSCYAYIIDHVNFGVTILQCIIKM
jgi:hypothetical protein